MSKTTSIPVDENSLVRTRHTPMHRAAMDKKAREKSVEDAFEVRRPKLIDGQHITLVDDIFTSGATAHYCAAKLKESGAATVNVLTIAHAAIRLK
ncbi:MAG: hypothetical protein QUS14_00710 [Pyrinomonadaceae bacterium]|nr:hypothetical protein [Pyrinomonadaceae bacterium]